MGRRASFPWGDGGREQKSWDERLMKAKYILALRELTVNDPLHGVSDWLKKLLRTTHYHPEKAYMRAHRAGGGQDRHVPPGGEPLRRGKS